MRLWYYSERTAVPFRRILYGFAVALVISCTGHPIPDSDSKIRIIVDPSTPKEVLAPWLIYAGTRAHWIEKKFFDQNPGVRLYQYTFAEEVEARMYCVRLWRDVKAKDGVRNRYLDDLITVMDAGFLEEYVWTYFRDSNWKESNILRLVEFDHWQSLHLRGHEPETRAVAKNEGS